MNYTEDGLPLYDCPYCLDARSVHPRKEDGSPDYSRTVPCKHCRPEAYRKAMEKLKN